MLQSLPPFAFIHLHTTTGTARTRRIVDVAIIRVGARDAHEWRRLLNPERPIPPAVQARTGIRDAMVMRASLFEEVAGDIAGMLAGHVLVAHDARAQYAVLKAAFARMDADFNARLLCTQRLSRLLFAQEARHDLPTLIARHGLPGPRSPAAHEPAAMSSRPTHAAPQADALASRDALEHARISLQFWDKLQRVVGTGKLAGAVAELTGLPVAEPAGSRRLPAAGPSGVVASAAPASSPAATPPVQLAPPGPAQAPHASASPRFAWFLAPDLISGTLTLVELGTPAAAQAQALYGEFTSKTQARRWLSALAHAHGLRRPHDLSGDAHFARLTRALQPYRITPRSATA